VRTDGLDSIVVRNPSLRRSNPVAVTSIKYHYSVALLDIVILDEMFLEAGYDGAPSGSFIREAKKMRRGYAEFVRKQVYHGLSVPLAALQILYVPRLVFIDANDESKHPPAGLEADIQSERPSGLL